jgi:LuxR family maltose regulon positive regulatory protein
LVVSTKLLVPRVRPDAILRGRLTRLLDLATRRRLTVVSAPAGYGKTTAVVQWLARARGARTWVSLDARDNDPLHLSAHLLAALDRALPGVTADAHRAMLAGADLVDTVVPLTVNALAARMDGPVVLVLDDYHVVKRQGCHRLLLGLVDSAPPDVRIVVVSRTSPPLRLGRRRVAGTVAEIGPEQLAFRGAESELLLNASLGLGLQRDQIQAIEDRVEGWPAGLSLIASSIPGRPDRTAFLDAFTQSSGRIAEYLIEEVLDATEPAVRDFLCRTSILGRLSPALCEAVVQDPSARELLAEVRRSNLFVTVLDPAAGWVRYHHLFAALLERELLDRSPELVPVLHLRASAWFEDNGIPDEAIRHATAAGDGERAARLLQEHWGAWMLERRYVTLRQMIAAMPPERGALTGFCEAVDTLCMALDGADLQVVRRRLDALERYHDAPGVAEITELMRVSPYYGDVDRAARDGWAFWQRHAGHPELRSRAAGQFATVLWFAGDLGSVRREIEPIVGTIDHRTSRVWALSVLALTAADEGDVDAAQRYAREAVEQAEASGAESALEFHLAYVALSEALRLAGQLEEAGELLAHVARVVGRLPSSVYRALVLVFQAQVDLAARDRRRARTRASAARRIIDRHPDVGTLADRLAAVEASLERRSAEALLGSKPTPAEMRVLELLASDLTLKAIASDHLYVSLHTVTSHAQRLYRRLGARTRAEAVAAARDRGLL